MVLKKSASRPQVNILAKMTKRRASLGSKLQRQSSNSLSSSCRSGSYTRLHQLGSSFLDSAKLERSASFSKARLSMSRSGRRRRRRESSKNSELSKSSDTMDSESDYGCFDSFSDFDIDQCVLYNQAGEEVSIKFGHDYLSVNGKLILYEHIIYWGHTKRCFKVSYVSNMSTADQDRVDIALYPNNNEKLDAATLAQILQSKVAALYKELTGCSEDEAWDVASKEARKADVEEVLNQVDQTSEDNFAQLVTQDI